MDNLNLIKKYKEGDENALDKILIKNKKLVYYVISKYFKSYSKEKEDLFQVGCIGLIKSIKNFNLDFKCKWTTYAVPKIYGEISRYLRDNYYSIKASRSVKEIANKILKLETEYGDLTIKEISNMLNIDEKSICNALLFKDIISLDKQIFDNNIHSNLESFIGEEDNRFNNIELYDALLSLNDKERKIIYLSYFKDKTQQEISDIVKISQVQVSRIIKNSINKMKEFYGLEIKVDKPSRKNSGFKNTLDLFNKGLTNDQVANKLGLKIEIVRVYRSRWNKMIKKEAS